MQAATDLKDWLLLSTNINNDAMISCNIVRTGHFNKNDRRQR